MALSLARSSLSEAMTLPPTVHAEEGLVLWGKGAMISDALKELAVTKERLNRLELQLHVSNGQLKLIRHRALHFFLRDTAIGSEISSGVDVNQDVIEKGNKVAHEGDVLLDYLLFSESPSVEPAFETCYGIRYDTFDTVQSMAPVIAALNVRMSIWHHLRDIPTINNAYTLFKLNVQGALNELNLHRNTTVAGEWSFGSLWDAAMAEVRTKYGSAVVG